MGRGTFQLLVGGTVAGSVALAVVAPVAAAELGARLLPIFAFVIGMSVVVNIAAEAGVFDEVTRWVEDRAPAARPARRFTVWAGLIVLAVVVTVFFSLDTTAILLTPLAVSLARRNGISVVAAAFAVVWIANIGSLPLPVSNLTNLLAAGGPAFVTTTEYSRFVFLPGTAALAVAVSAAWFVHVRATPECGGEGAETRCGRDPLLPVALGTVGCLLPALVSPIPYWLSSTVAAGLLLVVRWSLRRVAVSGGLVPWRSLLIATGFSVLATVITEAGGQQIVYAALGRSEESTAGLFALAGAGAVMSNLINNIPAYLVLEPAAATSAGVTALLIGVNAGPLVTPWASLATLLWHDQLTRSGVVFPWRRLMVAGILLVPFAVGVPTAVLTLQVS